MSAHNEQQGFTAADMADQAAAAFERGRESVFANPCRCIDCGGVELAHSDDCTNMAELHGTPAAPGIDLHNLLAEMVKLHDERRVVLTAHMERLKELPIDASPQGASDDT